MKIETGLNYFIKLFAIKFGENLFSGSRVCIHAYRQTDGCDSIDTSQRCQHAQKSTNEGK
jgi:hypothetical protein